MQASGNGRKTKKEINEVKVKGKTNHKVQALQGSETFLLAKRPKRPTRPQRPKRPQRPLNLTPLSVIMTSQTSTPTYKGNSSDSFLAYKEFHCYFLKKKNTAFLPSFYAIF